MGTKRGQSGNKNPKVGQEWEHQMINEIIDTADRAARAYDSFGLYRAVNRLTPKRDRRKVRLRNAQGGPASPIEAQSMVKTFVEETWKGTPLSPRNLPAPGVPFTLHQLEEAIRNIPNMKGVAHTCAPGLAWNGNKAGTKWEQEP